MSFLKEVSGPEASFRFFVSLLHATMPVLVVYIRIPSVPGYTSIMTITPQPSLAERVPSKW